MAIEIILRRYFHVVALLLIAVAAYFQARGAALLIGIALNGKAASTIGTKPKQAKAAELKSGEAIVARNPFDSALGPLPPTPVRVDRVDLLAWPACEGVQVVIVTESSDPWWSLTTLRVHGEPRARPRRVGDGVAGKQVAFIGFNPRQQAPAVWLEGPGAFCQATLFGEPTPKPSAQALDVDRRNVEQTLRDPLATLGPVRVVPEQKDGKLVGIRLFGIRPSTLLGSIGLRSGDRLESINGFSVASPEKALEAYAHLRTARRLSVHLSRVGRPVDLELNIN